MSDQIVIEGEGCKLGRVFKNWKTRWFVLRGTTIFYSARQGGRLKGSIALAEATNAGRETPQECDKQPAFKIELGAKRTFFVQVREADIDHWVNCVKAVIAKLGAAREPAAAKKVSVADFVILGQIARAHFGTVQLMRHLKDNQLYANRANSSTSRSSGSC